MFEDLFHRRCFGWIRHNRSAVFAASGMTGPLRTLLRIFTYVVGEVRNDGVIFLFVGVSDQFLCSMNLELRQTHHMAMISDLQILWALTANEIFALIILLTFYQLQTSMTYTR